VLRRDCRHSYQPTTGFHRPSQGGNGRFGYWASMGTMRMHACREICCSRYRNYNRKSRPHPRCTRLACKARFFALKIVRCREVTAVSDSALFRGCASSLRDCGIVQKCRGSSPRVRSARWTGGTPWYAAWCYAWLYSYTAVYTRAGNGTRAAGVAHDIEQTNTFSMRARRLVYSIQSRSGRAIAHDKEPPGTSGGFPYRQPKKEGDAEAEAEPRFRMIRTGRGWESSAEFMAMKCDMRERPSTNSSRFIRK
jgi:hypothetical protein